jgi:hypothetical protein
MALLLVSHKHHLMNLIQVQATCQSIDDPLSWCSAIGNAPGPVQRHA